MAVQREVSDSLNNPFLTKFAQKHGPLNYADRSAVQMHSVSVSRELGIISAERRMGELGTAISRRVVDLFTKDLSVSELKDALIQILPEVETSLMSDIERLATLVQIVETLEQQSRTAKQVAPWIRSIIPDFDQAVSDLKAQIPSRRG